MVFLDITKKIHSLGDPDAAGSVSSRQRGKRFAELLRRFPKLDSMRVLDLGGTPTFWYSSVVRPRFVTTMNLDAWHPNEPWIEHVVADACVLDSLEKCAGDYDLVISNSLIEHVGGYQRRVDFAKVVTAAAPSYWVQTPNRSFPIEPHYLAPGFQFLPVSARAKSVRRWPFGHERVHTTEEALAQVLNIELISTTELHHLFPDAEIWHERLAGLSKSIVAVKTV